MNNQDSFFQAPAVVKNAAYFRSRARAALKGRWPIAILVAFLATLLCGSFFSWISSRYQVNLPTNEAEAERFLEMLRDIYQKLKENDFRAVFDAYPVLSKAMLATAVISGISALWSILISPVITVGYRKFDLDLIDGNDQALTVSSLFRYFNRSYLKCVAVGLLNLLLSFVCALPVWVASALAALLLLPTIASPYLFLALGALLICLGFVATIFLTIWVTYSYRFSYQILAEYPQIGAIDAMRNSRTLMKGNKWRLFCLQISFIGWLLLSACCTCGLGMLVLNPYIAAAETEFYSDLTRRNEAKETEFPSLDPNDYKDSI